MQPIQDQIFTAVQEIASNKKFDFVFDKSADVVMLYSADRFDISEQVLRSITRTSKRTQAQNRKERKVAEDEELVPEINKSQEARAKVLADKKASREKAIEDKRAKQLSDREAKRKALEDKKKKILEDRAKAREEKLNARNKNSEVKTVTKPDDNYKEDSKAEENKTKEISTAAAVKKEEPTLSPAEAKKKALEDKKKKILADRKAKLEARKKSTKKEGAVKTTDSTKIITKKLSPKEARMKALEDKKKKILADRKAKIEARQRAKDSIKNKENN